MTILTDYEIIEINQDDFLQPLSPLNQRSIGIFSGGLSSHGYDICLSNEWKISKPNVQSDGILQVIDPTDVKNFDRHVANSFEDFKGDCVVINSHEFILAASREIFDMPDNVCAEVKDKSSWARLGLQVFNTIIECGWKGRLVIEIYNNSANPIKLTSGFPIAQVVFHKLNRRPINTYKDRKGKYMNQGVKGKCITASKLYK